MTHLNFTHKAIRLTLAFALVAATFIGALAIPNRAEAAPVDCSRGVNLSFEQPVIGSNWEIIATPGWSTNDAGTEIWQSGFNGAVAPNGNQLAELQANNNSADWQDFPTLPGDIIDWSFFHKGRQDNDTVRVNIGSPGSQTNEGEFTTGPSAFVQYGDTYSVPAAQTTTRFVLQPVDTGSVGNLVDLVAFNLTCEIGIVTTSTGVTDSDTSGTVTEGDVFSFSYEVTNLGTATLANVGVTDDLGDTVSCAESTLVPNASTTCTMSHAVTQPEIDAGAVESVATVSGTDAAGVQVTAGDTETVPVAQVPSIALLKNGTLDDTIVAPSGRPDVGDAVDYTFDVTNTGNVTLSSISVADAYVPTVACPPEDLAPGATVQCTGSYSITQDEINDGYVVNRATAYGVPPIGDAVNGEALAKTILPQVTSVDIAKSTTTTDYDTVGQTVTYNLIVTNTGNVALSDVIVSDINADDGSIECVPAAPASLAPGATATCTAGHTVTQDDLDGGSISNTASVTATGSANDVPTSDMSNEVVVAAIQNPGLEASKTATSTPVGDGRFTIAYTISVTNTGNVTATGVTVSDDLDAAFGVDGYTVEALSSTAFTVNPDFDGSADTDMLAGTSVLAPGVSGAVYLEVTTSPTSNSGPYVNRASVLADGAGQPTEAVADVAAELDVAYDLTIAKTTSASVAPGDDATWTISVTNSGPSAAFGPITVTDTLSDNLTFVGVSGTGWACTHAHGIVTCVLDGTLASGESSAVSITTTVDAPIGTSIQNQASVTAADSGNESDPSNNVAAASVLVDSLPVTGIDTADFGAIAFASILFGLLLLAVTGRKRRTESR